MTRRGTIVAFAGALVVLSAITVAADNAFSYVDEGDALPPMTLARHPEGDAGYVGEDQVSVFAFVKPGHDRSREIFERMRELTTEFEGRPVLWTLMVSDRADPDSLEAVAAACPWCRSSAFPTPTAPC